MRVPGRKFLRRTLRPLSKALFPGAAVLGYHRVATTEWDPLGLCVGPERFSQQVVALGRLREIVTLGSLVDLQAAGKPLERYAALTFDDGYEDFLTTVVPILESHSVPATVFVATGFTGRTFWWDEIAMLMSPGHAGADTLTVSHPRGDPWQYHGLNEPAGRAAAVQDLSTRLACASEPAIAAVLAQLRSWAGADAAERPRFGALNPSQLETLARHPLVEIGAHTVSHGCLAMLEPSQQRIEIERSRTAVSALPGVSTRVFSYPNGSLSDATPALVRSLGFAGACTSQDGTFGSRTDRFRIPRLWCPDAPEAVFRRWLNQWVAGAL